MEDADEIILYQEVSAEKLLSKQQILEPGQSCLLMLKPAQTHDGPFPELKLRSFERMVPLTHREVPSKE